jgi:hypothetical protein
MITAGVIGAGFSAVFGLIDWLALPSGTRAKRIGLWHGDSNVVIVVLFIVSWLIRLNAQSNPNVFANILEAHRLEHFISGAVETRVVASLWQCSPR